MQLLLIVGGRLQMSAAEFPFLDFFFKIVNQSFLSNQEFCDRDSCFWIGANPVCIFECLTIIWI